jgi:hypothetical protein
MSFAHPCFGKVPRFATTLKPRTGSTPVFRKHVTHGEIRRFNEPYP